jgi:hypothetical protein
VVPFVISIVRRRRRITAMRRGASATPR